MPSSKKDLTHNPLADIMPIMTQIALRPEDIDIANAYLIYGSAKDTSEQLGLPEYQVVQILERQDVRDYITGVYLDRGYRNRNKIGQLLDKMIDAKLEEAEESGMYTSKDLFELLQFAHKMRMDELKNGQVNAGPTVNIANFGEGNYGMLMERLLSDKGTK